MSRRVDAIHFTVVTRNSTRPTTSSTQPSVMPMMASVRPAALRIGSRLGPGRWISSPAGGGVCSGFVIGEGGWRLGDVDRGGQERGAEHEDADRRGDQRGADVPASEATVHGVEILLRRVRA